MADHAAIAASASQVGEFGIGAFDLAAVVQNGEGKCCQRVNADTGIMHDTQGYRIPLVESLPVRAALGRPDQPTTAYTVELPTA